jgi:hypothetical protein
MSKKVPLAVHFFWNEQSFPSLSSVPNSKGSPSPVSRVKIQTKSPANRVKTQIKNPANRHRIPAKAASPATRNKKQTARCGEPFRSLRSAKVKRKKYAIHDSLEDAMTASVEQAFLSCGGIFFLSFLAIWAFWFVERWRGDNAPKPLRQQNRE